MSLELLSVSCFTFLDFYWKSNFCCFDSQQAYCLWEKRESKKHAVKSLRVPLAFFSSHFDKIRANETKTIACVMQINFSKHHESSSYWENINDYWNARSRKVQPTVLCTHLQDLSWRAQQHTTVFATFHEAPFLTAPWIRQQTKQKSRYSPSINANIHWVGAGMYHEVWQSLDYKGTNSIYFFERKELS